MRYAILVAITFTLAAPSVAESNVEWINSAEAYFATSRERTEWFRLDAAQRETFQRRYWAMRDPSPGTDRNEFAKRSAIAQESNTQFSMTKRLTRSHRRRAALRFGPPARVRTNYRTTPMESPPRHQQEATLSTITARRAFCRCCSSRSGSVFMIEPFGARYDPDAGPSSLPRDARKNGHPPTERLAPPRSTRGGHTRLPAARSARRSAWQPTWSGRSCRIDGGNVTPETVRRSLELTPMPECTTHLTTFEKFVTAIERGTLPYGFRTTRGRCRARLAIDRLRLDLPP